MVGRGGGPGVCATRGQPDIGYERGVVVLGREVESPMVPPQQLLNLDEVIRAHRRLLLLCERPTAERACDDQANKGIWCAANQARSSAVVETHPAHIDSFTVARLKFGLAASYYDQMRSGVKAFVTEHHNKAICAMSHPIAAAASAEVRVLWSNSRTLYASPRTTWTRIAPGLLAGLTGSTSPSNDVVSDQGGLW